MSSLKLSLITILIYLFISAIRLSLARAESGPEIRVNAPIEADSFLHLWGYTAPDSLVQLLGIRTYAHTSANRTGYFLFDEVPVAKQAKEVCISSIDSERRVSFPQCINIPKGKNSGIGPLFLSPTLSISHRVIYTKTAAYASGRTIPNQKVEISLFELKDINNLRFPSDLSMFRVKTAMAKDLPILTTTSDQKGNFSFTLPSYRPASFRVFAKANYNQIPTPKSQTLFFSIYPVSLLIIRQYFPLAVVMLIFITTAVAGYIYNRKTGNIRIWKNQIIEKLLLPAGVRLRLKLRRLWYNYRDRLRSYQK